MSKPDPFQSSVLTSSLALKTTRRGKNSKLGRKHDRRAKLKAERLAQSEKSKNGNSDN